MRSIAIVLCLLVLAASSSYAQAGQCRLKLYLQENFQETPGLNRTVVVRESSGLYQEGTFSNKSWFDTRADSDSGAITKFQSIRFLGNCHGAAADIYEESNFSGRSLFIQYEEFPDGISRLPGYLFQPEKSSYRVRFKANAS
ncbi:MAG: hypothetical protein HOC70_07925 [Gammaproteobacteria bacterium]|jgi:hypothetical protein|nr:hypothetical protein [Gammaproteobacteria bacterium]MBT4493159.1 hypothetical protein [Gammaproteobacteria bacterium]MBT7371918.1 hypothetical protein [Gammaproteobacteria bacterium]